MHTKANIGFWNEIEAKKLRCNHLKLISISFHGGIFDMNGNTFCEKCAAVLTTHFGNLMVLVVAIAYGVIEVEDMQLRENMSAEMLV